MARIPEAVIERLKSDISLQRLAEAQGITLKKHGQDLVGLCPFHDDKKPSLVITPKKNLWHCLGACQSGGSVIDWIMQSEGVSFRHAVELLQNDFQPLAAKSVTGAQPPGAPAYRASLHIKHSTVRKLNNPFEANIEEQQLLNRVIDYYHETLKQNPEALAYLEKRGIKSPEVIEHFKLGVANRTLGYRLPQANRKDGAAIRGQLQKIGIYRGSGHEHFSGSIVIPVIDEVGNVREVYGRKLLNNLRKGTPKHCYLPGPHKGIFNVEAFKATKEIILCESLIDALSFWCNGYRNVTASYGIEGFTKEHLSAFKENNIERILIAYDRDAAGEEAANKLSKQLIKEGIDCYRINFPKGMDANEYALSMTPASKALGVVIRSAVWLGAGEKKPITTESINDEATKNNNEEPSSLVAELEDVINDVLPAQALPDTPKTDLKTEVTECDTTINIENRRYRVRGLKKNLSYDVLKINLMVMSTDGRYADAPGGSASVSSDNGMHIDTIDLYQSRPRSTFIKQASLELGINEDVIKADLGKVLLKCESLQEDNIKQTQTPKPTTHQLTDKEQREAIKLLKSKQLLKRIQKDFNQCGIVGEATNTLVGYLAGVSRKLDNPLAIIIQSTSAAGKSSLMDAVLRFIPEEDKSQYSAMTGQSLFYMGETDLKHKVLAIVEEEGASQAVYALKLLQSEGQLTIASTSKDPDTGKLVTQEYKVEGPVMIFLTTTAIEVDEELMNRCLVLTVNEDRKQTQAIHQLQRKKRTLDGLIQKSERETLSTIHQNAQRLLKPLAVVNPYAEHLTFLNDQTRTRRDHEKYLTLIDTIALLHQYQREIKTINQNNKQIEYVEVTLNDIEAANTLAHEVLGRTLDELPPQTRKLLMELKTMVINKSQQLTINQNDYRFSRRDIRDQLHWTYDQVRVHLDRLVEMEYVLAHRGGRGQSFVYELLYDGAEQAETPHLNGLIDIAKLKETITTTQSLGGNTTDNGVPLGGHWGGNGGALGTDKTNRKANNNKTSNNTDNDDEENTLIRRNHSDASYTTPSPSLVASAK